MLKILRIVKTIYFNTPLLWKYFLPVMKFDMNIEQLNFIWTEIKNLTIPGDVLEVGVGGGSTSVMINLHLRNNSIILIHQSNFELTYHLPHSFHCMIISQFPLIQFQNTSRYTH